MANDCTPTDIISGHQIRIACTLLDWSIHDLATAAKVPCRSVAEAQLRDIGGLVTVSNAIAIQRALEVAGIEFGEPDGLSVRLKA